ncbi:FAD-dependent oxidoreductase [Pedobacter sp. SYP-B3415]|uniref:FAD-dependent oxidoreductase n=1 Tax=Pedobacter sp. SYP-B3415 TaxID=2496641 RepID=UPI00101BB08E|nr:FAD-dependent oxidoreductase [Pedobacter sp. SYP-B3415]
MRFIFILLMCHFIKPAFSQVSTSHSDLVVYGGTSAGVMAAVQASKAGKSVILISPDLHLGGLSSSGLGFTDTGDKRVIGGLAREFYHRVYLHYQQDSSWKWQKRSDYGNKGQGTPAIDGNERTMWIFEPHVAENIMESFVREHKIRVVRNELLDRKKGVVVKDSRIVSVRCVSGNTYAAKMFIDATYEGDLMASAGVGYHIGREANTEYGEQWNGVQTGVFQHGHHFKTKISPYRTEGDANSGLLPGVSAEKPAPNGSTDRKLQAYCFRMCLSNVAGNRISFPKPDAYNPLDYELLARLFKSGWRELFDKFDPVPNGKTDTNNHGPFSTDYIGMNYAYPEASYAERERIKRAHTNYQLGLFYFLATDKRVPRDLQEAFNKWGLAKDEFRDNGNWPYQLYIREARRMKGQMVMTENEVLGKNSVARPVGMGSYSLDSHNTQRYVTDDGWVQNEGDIGVKAPQPYGIDYRAITPKRNECRNLLVPVCISASHTAYGSVRMEPVFMILGQSAATAACLAIDANVAVQDLDYSLLRAALLDQKQRLSN